MFREALSPLAAGAILLVVMRLLLWILHLVIHNAAIVDVRWAAERALSTIQIVTANMNAFGASGSCDRVVSVEIWEHMRNWAISLRTFPLGCGRAAHSSSTSSLIGTWFVPSSPATVGIGWSSTFSPVE
jgi:hypothetical protein